MFIYHVVQFLLWCSGYTAARQTSGSPEVHREAVSRRLFLSSYILPTRTLKMNNTIDIEHVHAYSRLIDWVMRKRTNLWCIHVRSLQLETLASCERVKIYALTDLCTFVLSQASVRNQNKSGGSEWHLPSNQTRIYWFASKSCPFQGHPTRHNTISYGYQLPICSKRIFLHFSLWHQKR